MCAADHSDPTMPELAVPKSADASDALYLSIVFHPDCERIGEVSDWQPGQADMELGRLGPYFRQPRRHRVRPLADRYLSRSPLRITAHRQGCRLDRNGHGSTVLVNGQLPADSIDLSHGQLRQGVVLTLAQRIVLLLHYGAPATGPVDEDGLLGESPAINRIRELLHSVGPADAPVLLLGESGTGKEVLARALHRHSPRSLDPWVAVNMAAIPMELAASELFGVRRGAFTGAEADRAGFFQQAQAGSLFLDEIGACPPAVQTQLLRALQTGDIQRAGGSVQQVDVRIIAATDADIGAGSEFSNALRHRLGGFEIRLPPLRRRREDLARILRQTVADFFPQPESLAPAQAAQWARLMQHFALYNWPGNVRELINCARQVLIANDDPASLKIPEAVLERFRSCADEASATTRSAYRNSRECSETEIREAMVASAWEVTRAAQALAISRQALYNRIQEIPGLRVAADIPSTEVETVYHQCDGELDAAADLLQVSRVALRRRWRALDLQPREY